MTRDDLDYRAPPATARTFAGHSTETPTAGHYRTRLVKGGHPVGVRIGFGPPTEPWTGEEMDRSHRWQATVNGELTDINLVWPMQARDPIDKTEFDYLAATYAWAIEHAPDSDAANPRRKINLIDADLPF